MPGTGYNIPISVSYARTETVNPILSASTTFNFDSPWASGGSNDQTSRLNSSATATSSAAEGNAASATQAPTSQSDGSGAPTTGIAGIPTYVWLLGAAIAVFGIIYLKKKG